MDIHLYWNMQVMSQNIAHVRAAALLTSEDLQYLTVSAVAAVYGSGQKVENSAADLDLIFRRDWRFHRRLFFARRRRPEMKHDRSIGPIVTDDNASGCRVDAGREPSWPADV